MISDLDSCISFDEVAGAIAKATNLCSEPLGAEDIEVDLYQYYPHSFLFRTVDYHVYTEYVDSYHYWIIVERLDYPEGWTDSLQVLVVYGSEASAGESEIVSIPNSSTYRQKVMMTTSFVIHPSKKNAKPQWSLHHNLLPFPKHSFVSRSEFNSRFDTDVVILPRSVFAIGWSNGDGGGGEAAAAEVWIYSEHPRMFYNIEEPMRQIIRIAISRRNTSKFYFLLSACDGFLENQYYTPNRPLYQVPENMWEHETEDIDRCIHPTVFPVFHKHKYILAQSHQIHQNPYAICIPDRHYFFHNLNHSFRSFHMGIPFLSKMRKIVYAGQDRDTKTNFFSRRDIDMPPRTYFRKYIVPQYQDIVVCHGWIDREEMIHYKYILDIDGRSSTWDATAWKLNSGSVIFKPQSIWKQWFYDSYLPNVHYVELKEDFSDIREKYEWCESHPQECMEMIRKCKQLFQEVYSYKNVIEYIEHVLDRILSAPAAKPPAPSFYINLDSRTDRRMEFETELAGYPIERFSAIPTPGFGILGCTRSHLAVLKLAKERDYPHVLIFEDDFVFLEDREFFFQEYYKILEKRHLFDVCMFAYNLHRSEPVVGEEWGEDVKVGRVLEASTASCYMVNRHYYQKIIDLYEEAIPLLENTHMHWLYANDKIWSELQRWDKWIYTLTRMGRQRISYSDNAMEVCDYGC